MNFLNNKQTSKKIIIALMIVMSFNFVAPNISQASFGGKLFQPIGQLLCGIGDVVIAALQKYFIGDGTIKLGGIDEIETDMYYIRYSPGLIFGGKIPGLDVNFISPNFQGTNEFRAEIKTGTWEQVIKAGPANNKLTFDELAAYGMTESALKSNSETDTEWYNLVPAKEHTVLMWQNKDGTRYTAIETKTQTDAEDVNAGNIIASIATGGLFQWVNIAYILDDFIEDISGKSWSLYKYNETVKQGEVIESSAKLLQPTVATWYKALRAIALVGLLSVLVYVGIRILISSTGQEKAKYKKMIIDWVAAICILFVLQYIMVFTLDITQKITDILAVDLTGEQGEDIMMSDLRNSIGNAYGNNSDFSTLFAQTVMYLALVVHTVMFTIQYLKRLIYMAFFTMIAPLIALTYPLDKIKDGQAQAFSTWIREYIFNALLQPMHLLLYYMFVSSASSLVEENPLYAIVAIGFLLPAEKFFRKMFGFDKASSANALGAAAGGALIMNAVNKMGQKAGKAAAGKADGSGGNQVRTASSNGVSIGSGVGSSGSGGGGSSGSGGGAPLGSGGGGSAGSSGGGSAGSGGGGSAGSGGGGSAGSGGGGTAGSSGGGSAGSGGTRGSFGSQRDPSLWGPTMVRALSRPRGIRNGASAVGRKYVNANTARKARTMLRKGIVGAAGAAALGTVGLAAGVATGDFGNALQYGAAGLAAGYAGANNLADKGLAAEKDIRETFKEGAIGQQEYSNLQSDREFYASDSFRQMVNDQDLLQTSRGPGRTRDMRREVQHYRDSGITDTGKISAAMKAGLTPQEGAYAIKLADMIGRSGWNNKNVREDFEKRYRNSMPTGADTTRIWNSIESLL